MRLLIVTQAVDRDDPVLGFFHRWIAEFAKHCESIHVVCLKEGRHSLPENVIVHSLGKEKGRSRIKYVFNFYRYIWNLRREYDSVFVHMNQEYVLLGVLLWRAMRKKIVLWRNHKMGSLATRIAARLAHTVCYTSPSAFVAKFKNAAQMPIGIDTSFFSLGTESPKPNSILFLGRLDPVKNVDIFIRALDQLHEQGTDFFADIVGDPTDPKSNYAHDVRNLAAPLALEGAVAMHPGVTNETARDLYRSHAIYVNLTPSGSFDKTIGEAMACGAVVVCVNAAVRDVLPVALLSGVDADSAAKAVKAALDLSAEERTKFSAENRSYVEREHSLTLLTEKLVRIL